MAKNKNENRRKDKSDWLVPAGLFIGLGVGFITNQLVGFLLLGLGLGFLFSFLLNKKR